ncbi:MAG: ABC transporter permease, partial [Clostridia bacterium]|nr:ABC transporter permease [Clostridia bacterium]
AVLCLARDYYQAGREAADKAVAVLRGTDPASIPFNNTRSETLLLNPQRARQFGLNVSPDLLHQAQLQD